MTEDEILNEFFEVLNDASGAHTFAVGGVRLMLAQLTQPNPYTTPDNLIYVGSGPPDAPGALAFQRWRVGDLPAHLSPDGPVVRTIGNQWVIGTFTAWEHEYRPRLAAARGCQLADVSFDLMGDLRLIRNDIVHNHGVGSPEGVGKCILLKWAAVDDPIFVASSHVEEFMRSWGLAVHGREGWPIL